MVTGVMFVFILDWLMREALNGKHSDIEWTNDTNLCTLDIAVSVMSQSRMQSLTAAVAREAGKVRLYMNARPLLSWDNLVMQKNE